MQVFYVQGVNDLISEEKIRTFNCLPHCTGSCEQPTQFDIGRSLSLQNSSDRSAFQEGLCFAFPEYGSFTVYLAGEFDVRVKTEPVTGLDQTTRHFPRRLTDTLSKPCQPVR